jgi:hypothetical protein
MFTEIWLVRAKLAKAMVELVPTAMQLVADRPIAGSQPAREKLEQDSPDRLRLLAPPA